MRCCSVDDGVFEFLINKYILKEYDFFSEKDLEKLLKRVFLRIGKMFREDFKGSYYVEMFVNEAIGCYLVITKKHSGFVSKEIDLKINVLFDYSFYFETTEFYILRNKKDIYFYNNKYYINTDKIKDIDNYIEFGNIIPINKIPNKKWIKVK